MATLVLQAAGSFLGGMLGPVGSAIGSAAGAMAGYMIDRSLIEGGRRIEGPRLSTMQPFMAEEGVPIARVYGTMRVGGNIIWATRFEEEQQTERQGGKGRGPKVTTYSYFCNVAFALCEGEIAGVRRIWADGREVDLEQVTIRIHTGREDQAVDPLIAAKQGNGNAPAYRGLAYAVIERFALADYGNRIPQFQFEVMRPVSDLNHRIKSVVLLPGATEYGLMPTAVVRTPTPGETIQVNRHVLTGASDLAASLDELQALCPNLEEIAVVVTWFGDDLRAGACKIRPAVIDNEATDFSEPWKVCGVERIDATKVSMVDGATAYGGTPSDQSVIECIAEIRSRGLRVALYPFLMMDIPADNALPSPYGGDAQPPFPWRGRITCMPGPHQEDSADKSAAARSQVDAFCGSASVSDFSVEEDEIVFAGDSDGWGFRRLVLHYATLASAAGGVDTFLLGSEMRGVSTLRDGANDFPFVEALCQLAGEVRTLLGDSTAISYGADWTEYFGHQPADGSGDVFFHLDPLWAHEAITAVGIDNYMPLSDWRDADYAGGNPDGFNEPYDRDGLRGQVATGEGYDWYYADMSARVARLRLPISDGAYGKPWVYRYKDLKSWWGNQHYNRVGGVEEAAPTEWVPASKPIWFTELGCPAVDKGPNQPNVFPDAKSSENAMPFFSSSGRSDVAQSRFLTAHMDHWDPASAYFEETFNPVSSVYDGRMVDPDRMYLWAWDARPFPAFPFRRDVWRDDENWHRGHWLNGRISSVPVADLIAAILADHELPPADVSRVGGSVMGYVVTSPGTARAALEPIAELFGVSVYDRGGGLAFRDENALVGAEAAVGPLVVPDNSTTLERVRIGDMELPDAAELSFVEPFQDYQTSVARTELPEADAGGTRAISIAGGMEDGSAAAVLEDWLRRKHLARDTVSFSVPATEVDIAPGALVTVTGARGAFLVTDVEEGLARKVHARRVARSTPAPWRASRQTRLVSPPIIAGAPYVELLDLPTMPGSPDQFRVAAYAKPWRTQMVYMSPEEQGFVHSATVSSPSTMGALIEPLGAGPSGRVHNGSQIEVALYSGELSSTSAMQMLNGANLAAVRADNGVWEVVQFADAEETAPGRWRLSKLLRGQFGTEDAASVGASAGASFVLLNSAVAKTGLMSELAGLSLNWKVGPSAHSLADPVFVGINAAGGMRSRLPLSPVHLRLKHQEDGATLRWIRRGRVDADSWLTEDIPLGEEFERYRIEVSPVGGAVVRTVEVDRAEWEYPAGDMAADFPTRPVAVTVSVRQISAVAGAGLAARSDFTLN
jgi:hypothetical protein